ncbi:MAG: acyl carrier protein [Defluviitaleaceae bacterium]|nr:acyl carrier protein [Defluviitaleaceae bacterium]MCL2261707.1 acyl carrier protein [Defluviitaleaceae bacterium]
MVFEKIRAVITAQLDVPEGKITAETSLLHDIGADSLDIFQIISNLEEDFGMEFPSDIASEIKTVGDAVNYINANLK